MSKKNYLMPEIEKFYMQAEQPLLNYSAQTSNPIDGGDPTGGHGNGTTVSPFSASAAAPEQPFATE